VANEIQLSMSLAYNNPLTVSGPIGRAVSGLNFNSLLVGPIGPTTISVATTGTTISLGQITSPYYAWFRNMDPTNYVNIYTSHADELLGANPMTTLMPGEVALLPLGSDNAPWAVANTAAIDLEVMILSR
jgi:hypothetical protein